jgi:hypothetical protein
MDRPPPDMTRLLASWREWGQEDILPGQVVSNLKKGGMREVLDGLGSPELLEPWLEWERARLGPGALLERLEAAGIEARLESLAAV